MKNSTLYSVVAGLVLGGMLLPGTVLAEKKTPFTSKETDTPGAGNRFMAGGWMYVFDGKSTLVEEASDSRVAGSGWYSAFAAIDLQAGAASFWGQFHIENERGAWDGYWTGNEAPDGLVATLVGSGDYEGLVSRWTSTSHGAGIVNWSGYIVENGPGDVPFKVSGWRKEQSVPPITDPTVMPFYVVAPLAEGWGQASHLGKFTDLKKIGLVQFTSPATAIFRGAGILEAANGDLLNWVAFGEMDSGQFKLSVFFAGGTGRFEHAVGFFAGPMQWEPPTSYTYQGTGTIRY